MKLETMKPLFERGYALHLLRPKSKAPIESRWTSGARKTWEELTAAFSPQMNIGVRLGQASKVRGGFLAVIDCDVKSQDPKHEKQMLEKFDALFGKGLRAAAPSVASGRGNGSKHVYILTGEPAEPRRLAQSPDFVKVKMPSARKPSKKEIAELSQTDIDAGWRIRPAWEIALMGEGQQVVLPPSIHPDSGKPYVWVRTGEEPLINPPGGETREKRATGELGASKIDQGSFVEVDLLFSDLTDRIIGMITEGDGVEDRSASLLSASLAMVRAGFSDLEILSVLTDPKHYLGEAAYEHAKTRDRVRAAQWVEKYTLRKARAEMDAANHFANEVEVSLLSPKEIRAIHEEVVEVLDWRNKIERSKPESGSKPKNTFGNVHLILVEGVGEHVFKYNEFSGAVVYGMNTPWLGVEGRQIKDIDILWIKKWFTDHFRFEPSTNLIGEVVFTIAHRNKFHPVREYLFGLEWDGVERADGWLKKYLGAEAPEPYLSAVSRKVLVAMVARVMNPGCKFDQVLILEGGQGVGKSTAVRHLAGDAWFSDAHINIKDKDAVLSLQAHWIIELGELSGMRKADVDSLKEFISRTTDKIRVPYGKLPEDFPRQCVFIGTTNNDEFLKDETGNRRYWPVTVGRYDFEGIKRARDQLFAEAVALWGMGEPLYLEDKAALAIAVEEQSKRLESDILVDILREKFAQEDEKPEEERIFNTKKFTLHDLFASDMALPAGMKNGRPEQMRVARALRMMGYKKDLRRENGVPVRVWVMEERP